MKFFFLIPITILFFFSAYLIFVFPENVKSIECENIYSYPGKKSIVAENSDKFFIPEYYECIDSLDFQDYKNHVLAFFTGRDIQQEKREVYTQLFTQYSDSDHVPSLDCMTISRGYLKNIREKYQSHPSFDSIWMKAVAVETKINNLCVESLIEFDSN